MMKLEDVPADVTVVWFGKKWDEGCTENIHVYAPDGEYCHECATTLGPRSSGVAERNEDNRWYYYDPTCWGDVLNERYAKETLKVVDEDYEQRPHPKDW